MNRIEKNKDKACQRKKNAYKTVLRDMMLNVPDMFKGVYDARNGNDSFMYGIQTVMEYIASSIDENYHQIFSDMFTRNMVECEHAKHDQRNEESE